jgi:hypothetical protein
MIELRISKKVLYFFKLLRITISDRTTWWISKKFALVAAVQVNTENERMNPEMDFGPAKDLQSRMTHSSRDEPIMIQ